MRTSSPARSTVARCPHRPADAYRGEVERAIADIVGWRRDGYRVVVVHAGHGPAERMREVLAEHDLRRPGRRGHRCRVGPDRRGRHDRLRRRRARLRRRHQPSGAAHRRGPVGPEGLDPRHAADAGATQEADRPARAEHRRLRRPRAARRRPLRRDEAARGRGSGSRVPRPRVRLLQARRPARPALRAGGRARPGDPVRRRRDRRPSTGSAARTGPSARTGPARRSARSRPS